jgi:hypothetical protein
MDTKFALVVRHFLALLSGPFNADGGIFFRFLLSNSEYWWHLQLDKKMQVSLRNY